jgi:hypothetical protein
VVHRGCGMISCAHLEERFVSMSLTGREESGQIPMNSCWFLSWGECPPRGKTVRAGCVHAPNTGAGALTLENGLVREDTECRGVPT